MFYRRKTQKNKFGKKHVGSKKNKKKIPYWALEPQLENLSTYYQQEFTNKCLLICTIFSLLQHLYFESNKKNYKFLYLSNINSKFERKKLQACKILSSQLDEMFSVTKLQTIGPYNVQITVKMLSETYKCQFFVFSGSTGRKKIAFMYPSQYDDSLKPIYLQVSHSDPNHFIFIRNLNSYFRQNYVICFECKKSFSSMAYKHLCSKRKTCFACRRFFCTKATYMHDNLLKHFCDRLITKEKEFLCKICNVTLYSKHCYQGHRLACNGLGHYGFRCLSCSSFTYASKHMTSGYLKATHVCSSNKTCKFCYSFKEVDHLCKLSQTKVSKWHNRLGFFDLQYLVMDDKSIQSIFAVFYLEQESRGNFQKYFITDMNINSSCTDDRFFVQYFPPNTLNTDFTALKLTKKVTNDFVSKLENLSRWTDFTSKLIFFIISSTNTTFVCQDGDGTIMVRTFKHFIQRNVLTSQHSISD